MFHRRSRRLPMLLLTVLMTATSAVKAQTNPERISASLALDGIEWRDGEYISAVKLSIVGACVVSARHFGLLSTIENRGIFAKINLEAPPLRGTPPSRDRQMPHLTDWFDLHRGGTLAQQPCPAVHGPIEIKGFLTFTSDSGAERAFPVKTTDFVFKAKPSN